jgi:hypothetical protein
MGKISIIGQIQEIDRETALRERVYPREVAAGRMKQGEADMLMERIRAVRETLVFCQNNRLDFIEYVKSVKGREPK